VRISRSGIAGPSEATIHQQVAEYLKLQHRNVIFRTDFAAGIKMTMFQAIKHKKLQSGKSYPDLFIAEPRGGYHGLYLELKKAGTGVFLKDGTVSKKEHFQNQAATLQELRDRGYMAEFAVGFDEARSLIDRYLSEV
jgi:hypothetical protein